MSHTIYNFDVVGYNKAGKRIDGRNYQTHHLNSDNRHWCVVQRMAKTVLSNRKVSTVRYFLDGKEYAWNDAECEFQPTGKVLRDFDK